MANELMEVKGAWRFLRTGAKVLLGVMLVGPALAGVMVLVLDQRYVTSVQANQAYQTKDQGEKANAKIEALAGILAKFSSTLENVDDRTKFMCAQVQGATRDECR